ncbi:MAG: ParA family protein [Hymenobacter sp.]|nr:MAG: ParA family protein [Hymenobacter sp.]
MKHNLKGQLPMQVLAVANNKGGVGKTTTAVSLGGALHQLHGARVLMVDLDPQANLTQNLIGRSTEVEQHVGHAIIDKSLDGIILETESGLHLVPSAIGLAQYESLIPQQKMWRYRLAQTLATVASDYDYVVLDCPPTLQTFTVMALVAADAYLIATEPELFALSGLSTLTELADGVVEGLNSKLRFAGVTVTRYNSKQKNSTHSIVMQALAMQYGEEALLPSIRRDSAIVKSQGQAQTIFQYDPQSNAAQDYAALTASLINSFTTR